MMGDRFQYWECGVVGLNKACFLTYLFDVETVFHSSHYTLPKNINVEFTNGIRINKSISRYKSITRYKNKTTEISVNANKSSGYEGK